MFKNQGLFSSLPCPSTHCTLQRCLFNHQPTKSALEPTTPTTTETIDTSTSQSHDGRSKKRRIERSAAPSQNTTNELPFEHSSQGSTSTIMCETRQRNYDDNVDHGT